MMNKNLGLIVVLAVVAWLLLRKKAPPAVAGDVTSGSKSVTIDTNVLSDTFGEVITGPVAATPETP